MGVHILNTQTYIQYHTSIYSDFMLVPKKVDIYSNICIYVYADTTEINN